MNDRDDLDRRFVVLALALNLAAWAVIVGGLVLLLSA